MLPDKRAALRAVIKRVHPDLFAAHPTARAINAESLKVLNAYCDDLESGRLPTEAQLRFFVRDANCTASATAVPHSMQPGPDGMFQIHALLPARGSLAPLLHAFGLLSDEELRRQLVDEGPGRQDINLVVWLHEMVTEAVRSAEASEALQAALSQHRATILHAYQLADLQAGGGLTAGGSELNAWLHALDVLDAAMSLLTQGNAGRFAGLSVRLLRPEQEPDPDAWRGSHLGSYLPTAQTRVSESGCLHIVADERQILDEVAGLDLTHARMLARLSSFWRQQAEALVPAVRELLGTSAVWHDSGADLAAQRFVLWASRLLEKRELAASLLAGQPLPLSLLVHCDEDGPELDLLAAKGLLQVRHDCPAHRLLHFLAAAVDRGMLTAHEDGSATAQAAEDALLEAAREALGARRLIRVCSQCAQEELSAALYRLIDNAAKIRSVVNLTGASIAIDDRFEVWDTGYISIPFDFRVEDLQHTLRRYLLGPGSATPAAANGAADGCSRSSSVGRSPSAGSSSSSGNRRVNGGIAIGTASSSAAIAGGSSGMGGSVSSRWADAASSVSPSRPARVRYPPAACYASRPSRSNSLLEDGGGSRGAQVVTRSAFVSARPAVHAAGCGAVGVAAARTRRQWHLLFAAQCRGYAQCRIGGMLACQHSIAAVLL